MVDLAEKYIAEEDYPAEGPRRFGVKTYLVLQRVFVQHVDKPNVRVVTVKLTRAAAEDVVNAIPGTYIVKKIATK